MLNLSDGFDMGGAVFPWGTVLSQVAGRVAGAETDDRSVKLCVPNAMGLPVLSAEVRGPARDRPVLHVWYELKHDAHCVSDDGIVGRVSQVLGEPASRDELPVRGRDVSSGVRCVAKWAFDGFNVGLSIYGGPRELPEGLSSGCMHVSWSDEITAAAPYIRALEESDARLADYAKNSNFLCNIPIQVKQDWRYMSSYPFRDPHLELKDDTLRKARRSLGRRQLRETPKVIAEAVAEDELALWKSESDGVWCLSNQWESVCFPMHSPVTATYTDVLPARGGGATYLVMGPLQLWGGRKSAALAKLAGILEHHRLAAISYHTEQSS